MRLRSKSVEREIKTLGENISIARRRRRMTQKQVANGAGVTIDTVRRLERGDPGVSLGNLGMILLVLGEHWKIREFLDIGKDDVGLLLSIEQLPMRVVGRRRRSKPEGVTEHGDRPESQKIGDYVSF